MSELNENTPFDITVTFGMMMLLGSIITSGTFFVANYYLGQSIQNAGILAGAVSILAAVAIPAVIFTYACWTYEFPRGESA